MPWYRMRQDLGGPLAGVFHMNFGRARNRKAPRACSVCGYFAERLCDRIVDRAVLIHRDAGRCSVPLCVHCTFEPEAGKDLCPGCALAFKAWCAARTNSTDGEGP